MVEGVSRFNGDKVPFYLEAYNAKMEAQEVNAALKLESFCRAVADRIHAEVKELREAHSSWEAFEEALRQAYGELPKSRNRRDFDQWVASTKTYRGATKAFREVERCFARLPEREQRLVGADKVLLFVRSIDWVEREAIEIELEEDDGENGLIEDWSKVRKVCQRLYDERAGKARWKACDGRKRVSSKQSRRGSVSEPGLRRRTQISRQCLRKRKERGHKLTPRRRTFPARR